MAHASAEYHKPSAIPVRLGDRGRLVLPAVVRRQLQLRAGERLLLTVDSGSIRIAPARLQVGEARGIYRHLAPKRSLADELIEERRAEAAHERTGR
jgi:AbrB family looped-hinge helix DNA binding protein